MALAYESTVMLLAITMPFRPNINDALGVRIDAISKHDETMEWATLRYLKGQGLPITSMITVWLVLDTPIKDDIPYTSYPLKNGKIIVTSTLSSLLTCSHKQVKEILSYYKLNKF